VVAAVAGQMTMDANEFFRQVVVDNCNAAKADPTNFAKLWNAAVSLNTMPEYLALHRAGYPELTRDEVDEKTAAIRSQYPVLGELNSQVVTLKHVRSHKGQEMTASSTAISLQDPNSFAGLKDLVERAFTTLMSTDFGGSV
jgi:hypothetical protein